MAVYNRFKGNIYRKEVAYGLFEDEPICKMGWREKTVT